MKLSYKLTGRDITALIILAFFLYWSYLVAINIFNPQEKYKKDQFFCKQDYDCQVVYDLLNGRCYTVNLLHKDKYDTDISCRKRNAVCVNKKCYLP